MQDASQLKNKEFPNVKFYASAVNFLKAVYDYRKSFDSKYSLDLWCAELGFKSRSFMYMVISGKRRITTDLIDALSVNLNLNNDEKIYFSLLAKIDAAETSEDKKLFLDKIFENKVVNQSIIESKNYLDFLSDLDLPVIKLILSFKDFPGTAKYISHITGKDIQTVELKLAKLEELHLATKESKIEDTRWRATTPSFSAPKDSGQKAVNIFHQNTLTEASLKLEQNDLFKRFRSIYFSVNEDEKQALLEEIELFLNRLKNKFGNDYIHNKELIKFNLQAYSVTKNRSN